MLYKNHLTNLSTMPQPISQTWEFSIPIPHWILAFFHIEGVLIIVFEVTISAYQSEDYFNIFNLEISCRLHLDTLYPEQIEQSKIVLGYLWPNPYYQVDEEEIIWAPSRVSLASGVTTSESSTYTNSPEPPQAELPIPPNHFTLGLWILSELPLLLSNQVYQEQVANHFNWPPLAGLLTPDEVLAQVRSGVNLDKLVFNEENITLRNLQNIDHNANPHLYSESSQAVDNNYKQPHHKASENKGWGVQPSTGTRPIGNPLKDPRIRAALGRAILQEHELQTGETPWTIIEEMFWERMTPELE